MALLAFWHLLTGGAAHGIPFLPPQTKTTAKTTRHDPSHASLTKIGLQLEPEGSFWDGEGDWIAAWIRFVCSFLFGRKVEQYGHLHCTLKLANRKYNSLIESLPKKKTNGEINAVSTNELKRHVVPSISRLNQLSHVGRSSFEVS